jgi:hypothetical protein
MIIKAGARLHTATTGVLKVNSPVGYTKYKTYLLGLKFADSKLCNGDYNE